MRTLIHQRVESAQRGDNPTVIARMPAGWAVVGDSQVLRGYCLLLPDPVVASLNDLKGKARSQFLDDMTRLGDALLSVTDAVRINYEILGNLEPALHAHVVPRYGDEPDATRTKPFWFYDWNAAPPFDLQRDSRFMEAVREELERAS